jgi:hypothetical protein
MPDRPRSRNRQFSVSAQTARNGPWASALSSAIGWNFDASAKSIGTAVALAGQPLQGGVVALLRRGCRLLGSSLWYQTR